ncbi:OmpA family protein [Actinomadura sp. NBRC 104412]|uniref:OmpA family protein n=1 Tax=Actinomadura sp. NBRC 104412 TaxID=3032203 RepID=UPI002553AA2A|nr:OmpA family protein [Actinomadura sp. NBRC 104412]
MRTSPVVLTLGAFSMLAAGCIAPSEGDDPQGSSKATQIPAGRPGKDDRRAIASTTSFLDPKVRVDLVGLNRFGGEHVVVQLRLTNGGSESFTADRAVQDIAVPRDSPEGRNQASGIGLIDAPARRVLLPYRGGGKCACTSNLFAGESAVLTAGETATYYAVVPAPSGNARTTTVFTTDTAPMANVPISDEPPVAPPGQAIPVPTPDLKAVSHAITSSTEALDDTDETHDDGRNLRVNLRSDVLFALNKAELTPKAQSILKATARRIDASPATTVKVEGHADNSGNDAINDPLSQRRADTVAKALQGMVTRSGVGFQPKGYGSKRPEYNNESAEGRRRNRRVTVIFARPKPPERAPAPAAPAGRSGPVSQNVGGQPFTAQVTGLKPLGNGLGLLTYRVTNNGTTAAAAGDLKYGEGWLNLVQFFANNAHVIDTTAGRRYQAATYPIDVPGDNSVACLCSPTAGTWAGEDSIQPRASLDYWAVVQLPTGTAPLSVQLGKFPRIQGVGAG